MKPLAAINSLQQLIEKSHGGHRDSEEWAMIQRLLTVIRSGIVRQYAKYDELEEWVDAYFSERKHRQYTEGLLQIRVWILRRSTH